MGGKGGIEGGGEKTGWKQRKICEGDPAQIEEKHFKQKCYKIDMRRGYGGMFRTLHTVVWETLRDVTTESSEGCGQKREISQYQTQLRMCLLYNTKTCFEDGLKSKIQRDKYRYIMT